MKRRIERGQSGVYKTKRGILLHFHYYNDGGIECWVEKAVRKTGGFRTETFMRNPTKELLEAFEWA